MTDHKRLLELQKAVDHIFPDVQPSETEVEFYEAAHAAVPELLAIAEAYALLHERHQELVRENEMLRRRLESMPLPMEGWRENAELERLRQDLETLQRDAGRELDAYRTRRIDAERERDRLRAENERLRAILEDYDIRPDS